MGVWRRSLLRPGTRLRLPVPWRRDAGAGSMVKTTRRASAAILLSGLLPIAGFVFAAARVSSYILADAQTELQRYLATLMIALLLMVTLRFFLLLWLGHLH